MSSAPSATRFSQQQSSNLKRVCVNLYSLFMIVVKAALKRLLLRIFFTLLTLLLFFPSAVAQAEQVTVRLDGRAVFRVGAVGELDATARARQIKRRMNRSLANPEAIAPPRIVPTNANNTEQAIFIAGVPVVTVTQADVQDNLTTVNVLAIQWSQAIDTNLERASLRRLAPGGRFANEVLKIGLFIIATRI